MTDGEQILEALADYLQVPSNFLAQELRRLAREAQTRRATGA